MCAILEDETRTTLPAIVVRDGRRAAAVAAAAFYNWPALEVQLVGVTGTNGKTTTVGLLRHLLDSDTYPAASIGTLGVLTGSVGDVSGATGSPRLTVELQRLLRALVGQGVKRVVWKSHRTHSTTSVEGCHSPCAFYNLTRAISTIRHHGAYLGAKSRLIGCCRAMERPW